MKLKITTYLLATLLFLPLVSSVAIADDCNNLNKNPAWNSGNKKLEKAIKDGDDNAAILYGEALLEICPKLPKLNYMMAQLYKKRGDDSKTLYYLQASTRNTKEFVVDANVLEEMWTERVFYENPESKPENVQKLKDELAAYKESTQKLEEALKAAQINNLNAEDAHTNWSVMLWTGVGVTAIGLGSTIAGAVMLTGMDSPFTYDPKDRSRARVEAKYTMSWTLIGVGAAATVAGTFMMGYAGYHYTQYKDVSIAFSPSSIILSGTF